MPAGDRAARVATRRRNRCAFRDRAPSRRRTMRPVERRASAWFLPAPAARRPEPAAAPPWRLQPDALSPAAIGPAVAATAEFGAAAAAPSSGLSRPMTAALPSMSCGAGSNPARRMAKAPAAPPEGSGAAATRGAGADAGDGGWAIMAAASGASGVPGGAGTHCARSWPPERALRGHVPAKYAGSIPPCRANSGPIRFRILGSGGPQMERDTIRRAGRMSFDGARLTRPGRPSRAARGAPGPRC